MLITIFNKRVLIKMTNSTSNVNIDSHVVIGNGAITPKLSDLGYLATICFMCEDPEDDYVFRDLNVTRKHLESLKTNIENALRYFEKYGGDHHQ